MEDRAEAFILKWIIAHLPQWIGDVILPFVRRLGAVPVLKIQGLYSSSIAAYSRPTYLCWVATVKNRGSAPARECWVQLKAARCRHLPTGITPQPIGWGVDELGDEPTFETREIAPHDDRHEFVIAWTDDLNGLGEFRIAREAGRTPFVFFAMPEEPMVVTFNAVADNCVSRSRRFRVWFDRPGDWSSLIVRDEHVWSEPCRSITRAWRRFVASYLHG